jgi:hypothetical protein
MSADRLINLLVTIKIIQMMISVGLGVRLADIGAVATDWHLLIDAAVANYVLRARGGNRSVALFPLAALGCCGTPHHGCWTNSPRFVLKLTAWQLNSWRKG